MFSLFATTEFSLIRAALRHQGEEVGLGGVPVVVSAERILLLGLRLGIVSG